MFRSLASRSTAARSEAGHDEGRVQTVCVIAEVARPSAVTAHEQGEGFDDPSGGLSRKYDSRRIRREMSGKFPQPETAGPVLGGRGVHLVGGCDRVENYSQRCVGARNTKAQYTVAQGPWTPQIQHSGSEHTPSEPVMVENAPLY